MSFASRNNKAEFNIPFDTSEFEFVKCEDLEVNKVYPVYGYFSNVGMYGKQYSLITDSCYINLPKYMTDTLDGFSEEDVADIKAGKVGVKKRQYTSKNNKVCYTVEWVDR